MFIKDVVAGMDKMDGRGRESKTYYAIESDLPNPYEKTLDTSQKFVDQVFNLGKKSSKTRSVFDDVNDNKYKLKKKKLKKKRKTKGKYTNFEAIFSSDLSELRQLKLDQHKFTQDLQRKFDSSVGKSSYRGINKYETDLTMSIIQSRALEAQIEERISRVKETIYKMKSAERKDIAALEAKKMKDIAKDDEAFASSLMMNLMANRTNLSQSAEMSRANNPIPSSNESSKEIDDFFNEHLDPPTPHLQYESDGINQVIETHPDGSYEFVTYNKRTNEIIHDYPDPPISNLRFIDDQGIAKDEFGHQYEWRKK